MNVRNVVVPRGLVIACALLFGAGAQTLSPGGCAAAAQTDELARGFANPPNSARLRAYWWWLNGNVTKAAITRDLEEMKAKGFGGALICDAGGADLLGLEMSLNILSGWNLGGPVVKAEDAAKKLTWTEATTNGPAKFSQALPMPKIRDGFYRDIAVVAYRSKTPASVSPGPPHQPIRNWSQKAMYSPLSASAPDTAPLFEEFPAVAGEEDTRTGEVLDLTAKLSKDGILRWDVPAVNWRILRF